MAPMGTGKVVKVNTGNGYVLDGHEAHYLRGGPEGAQIVCIFTPPCTGQEVSSLQTNIIQKMSFRFRSLMYVVVHLGTYVCRYEG